MNQWTSIAATVAVGLGSHAAPAPVYDVGATAFRNFFALPGKEWCWTLDVPTFGVRFIAPDLDPRKAPASRASPGPIQCEGTFPRHLQGICTDGKRSIYWSWTDALVRTDLEGREARRTPVPNHHGDLCHHDGRVYVAVNLGKFNMPAGHAESWIYVYEAETLAELGRHRVPEVVHGAGGIAYHDGKFIVVGGLPEGTPENYLYEYDDRLVFQRRHTLRSGFTLMGIQTAARAVGSWWFGCYGQPRILLRADDAFRMTGRWESDAAYGIVGLSDGRLLVGRDEAIKGIGHRGRAVPAFPDAARGLVVAGEP